MALFKHYINPTQWSPLPNARAALTFARPQGRKAASPFKRCRQDAEGPANMTSLGLLPPFGILRANKNHSSTMLASAESTCQMNKPHMGRSATGHQTWGATRLDRQRFPRGSVFANARAKTGHTLSRLPSLHGLVWCHVAYVRGFTLLPLRDRSWL